MAPVWRGQSQRGAQRNLDPSVQRRPPPCCLHQALGSISSRLQGQLSRDVEKIFLRPEKAQSLASQCGSGQVLSTQPGFRVLLCSVQRKGRSGFAPQVLPSPGGLGLEGSRAHSAWNCSQSLPQSAWLLQAPPSLSARTCFLPSQRPPFISPARAPPPSPCSVSRSLAGPHPQRPPSYPPAPDIGRGCPGSPWLGPFRACLGSCPNQQ